MKSSSTTTSRLCHDYHWLECDRCDEDGREHVQADGHERPPWLCRSHARAIQQANQQYNLRQPWKATFA